MNQNLSRPSWVANELAGASVAAGTVAALLTLGIAAGIARLVAWNGRQRLANSAGRRCQEVEQFITEMASLLSQLANELNSVEPGMTHPLRAGLQRLRARNMWFLEENYRAFVLQGRGMHPSEIHRAIGEWVVGPLRLALDSTRKVVGQRLEERRATDRKRLNECIRHVEYELVECGSRLLSTDVSRPGERRRRAWRDKWRPCCLGTLAVLALPVGCIPGWHAADPVIESKARHVAPVAPLRDPRLFNVSRHRLPVHTHTSRTGIVYLNHPWQHE